MLFDSRSDSGAIGVPQKCITPTPLRAGKAKMTAFGREKEMRIFSVSMARFNRLSISPTPTLRVAFPEQMCQVASPVSLAQFMQRFLLKAKLHTPHHLHLAPSID